MSFDTPRKSDLVDVSVYVFDQSPKAWLVSDTGERKNAKWIPKSLCELSPKGKVWEASMPEWLAAEKGFI